VASGIRPCSLGGKFLDFSEPSNWMFRPDNKHYVLYSLKLTLERFAHFPINTSSYEKQPRLILVTVDVKTGDAVTFDSYVKKAKYHDDKNTISNQNSIEIEHALASGAFPDLFDYPKFKVSMNNAATGIKYEEHIFWDGGFRSNTPLRELVQAHRDYWLSIAKKKHQEEKGYEYENDVPNLEVYIADLWPSELKEDPISFDRNFIQHRQWDLILGDKTDYDE
jgi:NTE family protein